MKIELHNTWIFGEPKPKELKTVASGYVFEIGSTEGDYQEVSTIENYCNNTVKFTSNKSNTYTSVCIIFDDIKSIGVIRGGIQIKASAMYVTDSQESTGVCVSEVECEVKYIMSKEDEKKVNEFYAVYSEWSCNKLKRMEDLLLKRMEDMVGV